MEWQNHPRKEGRAFVLGKLLIKLIVLAMRSGRCIFYAMLISYTCACRCIAMDATTLKGRRNISTLKYIMVFKALPGSTIATKRIRNKLGFLLVKLCRYNSTYYRHSSGQQQSTRRSSSSIIEIRMAAITNWL